MLNPNLFRRSSTEHSRMTPTGLEPAIFWMRTRCPKPLDDGAIDQLTIGKHLISTKF